MNRKAAILISAILLGALTPVIALADDDDCSVPMAQWQPRDAVEQMAKMHGWTVSRIKVDDGCYEIRGQDEGGHAFEAKVDPGSLAVIRMKQKRAERDKDRGDTDRRGRQSGTGAVLAPPPTNGLFQGGTPPRVEVQ
ncbi:MAG: PepSY domain-containing protein [Alphaproteobacteria bacterium]